jgi:hypothetical protein
MATSMPAKIARISDYINIAILMLRSALDLQWEAQREARSFRRSPGLVDGHRKERGLFLMEGRFPAEPILCATNIASSNFCGSLHSRTVVPEARREPKLRW